MAHADTKPSDKGHGAAAHDAKDHKKHVDTGEHAKKNMTERAQVVDEGLGMSKLELKSKR